MTAQDSIPSLEQLVQQKRVKEEKAARPKFLSKAERARLALERRQKEVEEAKAKQNDKLLDLRKRTFTNHLENNELADDEKKSQVSSVSSNNSGTESSATDEAFSMTIRQRYMGIKPPVVKKRRRNADKKFVFDWDATDDTMKDAETSASPEATIAVFGRGKLGGFDDQSIRKAKSNSGLIQRLLQGTEQDKARAHELIQLQEKRAKKIDWDDVPWREKPLEAMKPRDWRILKEDYNISIKGDDLPNPLRNWEEAGLPSEMLKVLKKVNYKEPSSIQRAAIPVLLQRKDLIGIAETGSGKTAAFIIPLIIAISKLPPLTESNMHLGPYAVVLAPTRELAQQIQVEGNKFAEPLGFRCVSVVGGHAFEEQSFQMSQGAHIVVATPGRLLDCLERRLFVLSQCTYVVMDEADRMLDMGFEDDVNKILSSLPSSNASEKDGSILATANSSSSRRQTIMFSATLPPRVANLAKSYLIEPVMLTIGNIGQAVDRVEQRVEMISDDSKKWRRVEEILESNRFSPPIIIFVNLKRNIEAIAKQLNAIGWHAVTLHGSKSQEQRERAIEQLRNKTADILVATDIAGRGIDIPNVSLVLNYNMAKSIEDYTHRIGRTGRAGKSGTAITFLGPEDTDVYYDLRVLLSRSAKAHIPDELRNHEAAFVRHAAITQ
ncbi:Pre-mRNA-splicing ATP-dependent RNA helicase prp28 [Schizosaccharomyces pombe]|uniref:Pre-mRNA-splicing ATP-dependent RNA helicase prp28 n=1 Tax=Schizosaccharomyces pombe (strain 972 / ATCC 24843) TaxID=284812 RepID=PRP28_SCHPO|nr:putative U5 snRNP-associated protein Prp28 [Schizosaccharomyces pombe]Q9Y7T7.1 RecName: Full=Pre-mRNA-splicing ATP-dependent RNA helicase prp28 [Schizosaccharomyces pombe 972h-]CAB40015.1 U5 snRNP-associated protein Prp28 (predicted) [Schizosaccharomyces pombe]|eukprot:NP_587984.1 putative U5 snRNP-associated protein Prp28 [Schizosaccharomyces pombe]